MNEDIPLVAEIKDSASSSPSHRTQEPPGLAILYLHKSGVPGRRPLEHSGRWLLGKHRVGSESNIEFASDLHVIVISFPE